MEYRKHNAVGYCVKSNVEMLAEGDTQCAGCNSHIKDDKRHTLWARDVIYSHLNFNKITLGIFSQFCYVGVKVGC